MSKVIVYSAASGSYPKLSDDPGAVNLRRALARFDKGEISGEGLKLVYRDTIARVIKEQEQAGLDIITDGQIRWDDLVTPFAKQIEGMEIGGLTRYFDNNFYYRRPRLVGQMAFKGEAVVEDFRFASSLTRRLVKPVIVGPYTFAQLSQDDYYKDIERFTLELARILRREAQALEAAGAKLLQIDEPSLCFNHNHVQLVQEGIKIITEGSNLKIVLCLYFGGIKGIWEKLLNFPVSILAIDLVSDPANLEVVLKDSLPLELSLGLLDARNTKLEREDEIMNMLMRAAALSKGNSLYLSPNCGLEFLPHESAKKKLELMVACAHKFNRRD